MLRRNAFAAGAGFAAVLAFASLSAHAQATANVTAEPASTATPAASELPASAADQQPAPVAEQPAVPVDPLLAQVRQELAEPARGAIGDRADRAALAAFYNERNEPLIWVTSSDFTPRAKDAMAEIAKADNWGLSAAAFDLPQFPPVDPSLAALANAEVKLGLAVLKYARHARGGRLEPSQLSRNFDMPPPLRDPKVVIETVAATDTPGAYLQSLHPKHAHFQRLRQALLKARSGGDKPEPAAEISVRLPSNGPALKPGTDHADVALLRRRLNVAAEAGRETYYDRDLEEAVRAFQDTSGLRADGIVASRTRAALNGESAPKATAGSDVQRLIVNMERWRWMPEDLGEFHVWDNVPEFMARVVKKGEIVHSAKIVVGKLDNQTPIFSASMRYIVFHPEWGVPDGIKVKEIWPHLRSSGPDFFGWFGGGSTAVLERHNLRVSYNGRPIDPNQVNWSQVDIRRFTFIQPAGPRNVLGVVKFRFPNKHDVYMHDTPQRELFSRTSRTFSHGCMRVENPGRLAEILLEHDKGWSASQVKQLLAGGYNNEVELTRQIPVHVTYFTAMVGDEGQMRQFADIYGHDSRIAAALGGRQVAPEPSADADDDQPVKQVRRAKRRPINDDIW